MLTDVEMPEELVEDVCSIDIVVMLKHGESKALAESARTEVEEELVGSFNFLHEWSLVDIIAVILYDGFEVHHAVRDALRIFSSARCLILYHIFTPFLYCSAKIRIIFRNNKKLLQKIM